MRPAQPPARIEKKGAGMAQRQDQDLGTLITSIDRGRVTSELLEALRTLTEAVHDRRQAGSVNLKLTVKPRKGEEGKVDLEAVVTSKIPQPPHAAVMFVAGNYRLTRDDPTSQPMFSEDEARGDA